jgi:hypothetical protein
VLVVKIWGGPPLVWSTLQSEEEEEEEKEEEEKEEEEEELPTSESTPRVSVPVTFLGAFVYHVTATQVCYEQLPTAIT